MRMLGLVMVGYFGQLRRLGRCGGELLGRVGSMRGVGSDAKGGGRWKNCRL